MDNKIERDELIILWKLYENSRATYKQLSKECAISTVSCYNKVQSMKERGIIRRFTIEVDPKALGYNLEVFMELKCPRAARKRVAQEISKIGGVKEVWEVTGDSDLLVHAFFVDNDDLDKFISLLIKKFPEITDIITRMLLHKYEDSKIPWFFKQKNIKNNIKEP